MQHLSPTDLPRGFPRGLRRDVVPQAARHLSRQIYRPAPDRTPAWLRRLIAWL